MTIMTKMCFYLQLVIDHRCTCIFICYHQIDNGFFRHWMIPNKKSCKLTLLLNSVGHGLLINMNKKRLNHTFLIWSSRMYHGYRNDENRNSYRDSILKQEICPLYRNRLRTINEIRMCPIMCVSNLFVILRHDLLFQLYIGYPKIQEMNAVSPRTWVPLTCNLGLSWYQSFWSRSGKLKVEKVK